MQSAFFHKFAALLQSGRNGAEDSASEARCIVVMEFQDLRHVNGAGSGADSPHGSWSVPTNVS
jgi:hypothetical protein